MDRDLRCNEVLDDGDDAIDNSLSLPNYSRNDGGANATPVSNDSFLFFRRYENNIRSVRKKSTLRQYSL